MKERFNIINNEATQQFQIEMDGTKALLQYRFYKNDIALMHTEVPKNLEGKGIATALAHYALEWAKENNKKVMVYCPFVGAYVKKHPEYNSIIDRQYQ
jgi:predicted GNAT family acetyltransferase